MALFAAMSTTVALGTPAWESADEPSHVKNVEILMSGHWYRIPPHVTVQSGRTLPLELHQPPLYYLLLAGVQRVAGRAPQPVTTGPNAFPFLNHGLYQHHRAAQHRFLLLLRLPNVVMGLFSIWLTFLAARVVSGDPWTPVVAASIVAFFPKFVSLSAFVTNDNLVNLLGAALAYVAVRYVFAPGRWLAVALGGTVGAFVITKFSAVPATLAAIPAIAAGRGRLRRLETTGGATVAVAVVCGWYLVQNSVRYGGPLAIGASQRYLQVTGGLGTFGQPYRVDHPLRLVFSDVPTAIVRGFWYTSGWAQVAWPLGVSLAFWAALVAALAGLVPNEIGRGRPRPGPPRALLTLTVLVLGAFVSVWLVAFNTVTYKPRLALVGLAALACLAGLGLERWRLPVRAVLPLMCLGGSIYAIINDVFGVAWNR